MYRLKVREIAQKRHISQRKLFIRSGVDLKTIQRLFRDPINTSVTLRSLDRLAMALEVDISELIESIDSAPEAEQPSAASGAGDELED
ncbi:XRE family transcriptional regulator [Ktedonosporobacter rubrisoli]|uniref:XRE family transcriptional regulator n=1 Tax=Ktedonosporobacter rubrisoli TaxID=2509675 RepID=A0A4P6JXC7_KTERU|nr:XRE family transcriptional regulator [Ktedonosporobacter rubrisoli]